MEITAKNQIVLFYMKGFEKTFGRVIRLGFGNAGLPNAADRSLRFYFQMPFYLPEISKTQHIFSVYHSIVYFTMLLAGCIYAARNFGRHGKTIEIPIEGWCPDM